MKTILISTLLLMTMVVTKITAQDFYYYKNEKIPLTISEKNSGKIFRSIIDTTKKTGITYITHG
jgi:hypothetical protein